MESKETVNKPPTDTVTDTEDRMGGAVHRETGEGDYRLLTSSYKLNVSWYEIYSVGQQLLIYVILHVGLMATIIYHDQAEISRILESLCCIMGTNIVLEVNYTSEINSQEKGSVLW